MILVADDLSPSDTAGLDAAKVVGLATATGGPTSHTAILARTLGIPALVAGGRGLLDLAAGTPAVLDGGAGRLHLDPGEADLGSARAWIAAQQEQRAREAALRAEPATTRDGHRIEISANINLPDQAAFALAQGAEGVGLMRTEFLFLERGDTPDEDDQYATYRGMIEALGGRPLIVRALDIGGDKQVPHLRLPVEANPFLGVRGARLLLRRPDLLDPQLRALYRAAAAGGRAVDHVPHGDLGARGDARCAPPASASAPSSARPKSRSASWSRCRPPRCRPTRWRGMWISSPSAPTT